MLSRFTAESPQWVAVIHFSSHQICRSSDSAKPGLFERSHTSPSRRPPWDFSWNKRGSIDRYLGIYKRVRQRTMMMMNTTTIITIPRQKFQRRIAASKIPIVPKPRLCVTAAVFLRTMMMIMMMMLSPPRSFRATLPYTVNGFGVLSLLAVPPLHHQRQQYHYDDDDASSRRYRGRITTTTEYRRRITTTAAKDPEDSSSSSFTSHPTIGTTASSAPSSSVSAAKPVETTTATTTSSSSSSSVWDTVGTWPLIQSIQSNLDTISDGWVLSYANLTPDTPTTAAGRLFLATNLAYGIVGTILLQNYHDISFGVCCEVITVLSFNYHYQQLRNVDRNAVRLSLLCDYIGAAISILLGLYYVIIEPLLLFLSTASSLTMEINAMLLTLQSLQLECVICSIVSVLLLVSCWIYEVGKPYMILHGLWHIASAYAGYLIGTYHYSYVTMLATIMASQ